MLYLPSTFAEDLMDDFFTPGLMRSFDDMDKEFFGKKNPLYGKHAKNLMKTDVREDEKGFELDIELPGFKKEDVEITLTDGYLNIQASKGLDKEQKDEKTGRMIRQERYAGSLARSFYVGEQIEDEDIKAKMEHGVLTLQIPKKEAKPAVPEKKLIAIEG